MYLFKKIIDLNKKHSLISEGDRLIIGFSGGPDSVFLVEMLLKLRNHINFEMFLVHINHMLRGEEADKDEEFCYRYGEKNSLKVYSKKVDVVEFAAQNKLTFEEAGRKIRYKFYSDTYSQVGANKIVLAHNKDDQIETFLFKLIRGTSLIGLEGIKIKYKNIVRPIAEIYKKEILDYLDFNKIDYRTDMSNFEVEYTRNSIRLELIPFIEGRYNVKFKDKVFNLIEEIRSNNDFVNIDIKDFVEEGKISLSKLEKLDVFLIKKVINSYLNAYDIEATRNKIDEICKVLFLYGYKEISLNKNYILRKDYNYIQIKKTEKTVVLNKDLILKVPGKVKFGEYIIEAELFEVEEKNFSNNIRNEFFSSILENEEIIIRSRISGDTIVPIGMTNRKKVKDILINEKISKDKRDKIPILTYNGEIFWIARIKKSNNYLLKNEQKGMKFTVRREEEVE